MRSALVPSIFAAAAIAVLGSACTAAEGENGQYCLKNDDCESKHCASNVCGPQEKFGPAQSTGGASSGTGGVAGASGGDAGASGADSGSAGSAGSASPH